ncbi:MAG: BolA family transcriptional regulator [Pseudomonadota bacterium]
MTLMRDRIEQKLVEALAPAAIDIIDESHLHQGHMGWREGGETHFRVRIRADGLAALSRVDRHRRINEVLVQELADGVHALAIDAAGPDKPL